MSRLLSNLTQTLSSAPTLTGPNRPDDSQHSQQFSHMILCVLLVFCYVNLSHDVKNSIFSVLYIFEMISPFIMRVGCVVMCCQHVERAEQCRKESVLLSISKCVNVTNQNVEWEDGLIVNRKLVVRFDVKTSASCMFIAQSSIQLTHIFMKINVFFQEIQPSWVKIISPANVSAGTSAMEHHKWIV